MANFLNDLNKMVNTIQKVDKLLSEKPKRPRTKYITKKFTEKELKYLHEVLYLWGQEYDWEDFPDKEVIHKNLLNKFKPTV
jgi:hypothetical protein